eukprot:280260-Rhodomonas_salina.2
MCARGLAAASRQTPSPARPRPPLRAARTLPSGAGTRFRSPTFQPRKLEALRFPTLTPHLKGVQVACESAPATPSSRASQPIIAEWVRLLPTPRTCWGGSGSWDDQAGLKTPVGGHLSRNGGGLCRMSPGTLWPVVGQSDAFDRRVV